MGFKSGEHATIRGLMHADAVIDSLGALEQLRQLAVELVDRKGLIRSEKKCVEVINTLRRQEIDARFPGLLAAIFSGNTPPLA